jgi:hypothetical protein
MKKILESNENESTTYQNLWDTVRGKFRAMHTYIFKKERSQINHLMMHLNSQKNKNKRNPKLIHGKK